MKKCLIFTLSFYLFISQVFSITSHAYPGQFNVTMNYWEDIFIPKKILAGNVEFTDTLFISDALAFLSKDELRLLRNIIYAKHGKIFKSSDLSNYFSKYFEWYKPIYDDVDNLLSENEKQNINLIQLYENGYNTLEKIPDGYWRCFDISGYCDLSEIHLWKDHKSGKNMVKYTLPKFYFNDIVSYEGTYICENGFLIIHINKIQMINHKYIYEDYKKRNEVEFKDNEYIDITLSKSIDLRYPYFIDEKNDSLILGQKEFFR